MPPTTTSLASKCESEPVFFRCLDTSLATTISLAFKREPDVFFFLYFPRIQMRAGTVFLGVSIRLLPPPPPSHSNASRRCFFFLLSTCPPLPPPSGLSSPLSPPIFLACKCEPEVDLSGGVKTWNTSTPTTHSLVVSPHPPVYADGVYQVYGPPYYPVQGTLRGTLISNEHRATVSTPFRLSLFTKADVYF